jgi:MFS superfamily sulfate permease-like transporter
MSAQLPRAMGIESLDMETIRQNVHHMFSGTDASLAVMAADLQASNLISLPSLGLAAMTVGITMGIGRTKLASKLPPVMVAVAVTSALQGILQLPGVEMIEPLPALFASVSMPSLPSLADTAHIAAISALFVRKLSLSLALGWMCQSYVALFVCFDQRVQYGIGSLESLLSCGAVDKLAKARRGFDPNQELVGQGAANMACGMLGGMPATSVIARSSLSVVAGGKTRRVALSMSGLMLISTALLSDVFQHIPVPTLAGVLLAVSTRMVLEQLCLPVLS